MNVYVGVIGGADEEKYAIAVAPDGYLARKRMQALAHLEDISELKRIDLTKEDTFILTEDLK